MKLRSKLSPQFLATCDTLRDPAKTHLDPCLTEAVKIEHAYCLSIPRFIVFCYSAIDAIAKQIIQMAKQIIQISKSIVNQVQNGVSLILKYHDIYNDVSKKKKSLRFGVMVQWKRGLAPQHEDSSWNPSIKSQASL